MGDRIIGMTSSQIGEGEELPEIKRLRKDADTARVQPAILELFQPSVGVIFPYAGDEPYSGFPKFKPSSCINEVSTGDIQLGAAGRKKQE
jgi:hypothetical protein